MLFRSFHHRHLNVDELHRRARERDATLGYATVWRTLKLLERYGLVHRSQFGDGTARFEVAAGEVEEHHDHMICTRCGVIVEFENAAIVERDKARLEMPVDLLIVFPEKPAVDWVSTGSGKVGSFASQRRISADAQRFAGSRSNKPRSSFFHPLSATLFRSISRVASWCRITASEN